VSGPTLVAWTGDKVSTSGGHIGMLCKITCLHAPKTAVQRDDTNPGSTPANQTTGDSCPKPGCDHIHHLKMWGTASSACVNTAERM
jgi:hypothetical protein